MTNLNVFFLKNAQIMQITLCVIIFFAHFHFLCFSFFWDLCRVRLPETPRKFLHLGHHPHAEIFHRPFVVCTGTGRHQIHVRASGGRNPSAATYFLPDRCQYQKIQSGFRYIRLFFQFQKEKSDGSLSFELPSAHIRTCCLHVKQFTFIPIDII